MLDMFRSSPFVPEHITFKMYGNTNLMLVDSRIIVQFIKENPTRCNNVSTFYFVIPYIYIYIYIKLNMFPATHRSSSGA
jgi:hypothetical protein